MEALCSVINASRPTGLKREIGHNYSQPFPNFHPQREMWLTADLEMCHLVSLNLESNIEGGSRSVSSLVELHSYFHLASI